MTTTFDDLNHGDTFTYADSTKATKSVYMKTQTDQAVRILGGNPGMLIGPKMDAPVIRTPMDITRQLVLQDVPVGAFFTPMSGVLHLRVHEDGIKAILDVDGKPINGTVVKGSPTMRVKTIMKLVPEEL
jgi:hypothetical protein